MKKGPHFVRCPAHTCSFQSLLSMLWLCNRIDIRSCAEREYPWTRCEVCLGDEEIYDGVTSRFRRPETRMGTRNMGPLFLSHVKTQRWVELAKPKTAKRETCIAFLNAVLLAYFFLFLPRFPLSPSHPPSLPLPFSLQMTTFRAMVPEGYPLPC